MNTGQEIGWLSDGRQEAGALSIALSPDGALVATGGGARDNTVRLVEIDTDAARALGTHDDIVVSVAFNPSGALLASGDSGNRVNIWDVPSGRLVATFEGGIPMTGESFSSLSWVDENTVVAAAAMAIYRWDVATGELLQRIPIPEDVDFIVDVASGRDAKRMAAAAQDDALFYCDGGRSTWRYPRTNTINVMSSDWGAAPTNWATSVMMAS